MIKYFSEFCINLFKWLRPSNSKGLAQCAMWMISRPVSGPETDLCIKTKQDKTSVGNVQRKDTGEADA